MLKFEIWVFQSAVSNAVKTADYRPGVLKVDAFLDFKWVLAIYRNVPTS